MRVYKDSAEILNITTDEYYADNNRVGRTEYQYSGYTDTYTSAQDKFNRVVKETSPLGTVTFGYDDLGRVTARTAYGKVETYGYMANAADASCTTPLANSITYSDGTGLKYTYNSNGNIVRIDDQSGKTLVSYEYDTLNRLTRENDSQLYVTYQYYYDNSGNLSYKEEYAYTTTTLCPSNVRMKTVFGYSGNRLTSNNGRSCVYDANGNPTTYDGKTLKWTRGRLMEQYGDHTFVYNADGIRVKKNSIEYILDGDRIIAEKENGSITKRYFYDGTGIAGMEYAGAKYYFRKNLQGDVTAILDESGTVIGTYIYGAWGRVTTRTTGGNSLQVMNGNPFRYRGYYYDTETSLYYLNSRYYDPAVGRFLNADTFSDIDPEDINGLNLYAYCNNNPVKYADPSGHFAITTFLIGLAITTATFALVNTASQLVNDIINVAITGTWESGWEDYIGEFIGGAVGGAVFFLTKGSVKATFAAMGGAETLVTSLLTNVSGKTSYSIDQILLNTVATAGVGYLAGRFLGGAKWPGITTVNFNYLSLWNAGLQSLRKSYIPCISKNLIKKGIIATFVLRSNSGIISGLFTSFIELLQYFL